MAFSGCSWVGNGNKRGKLAVIGHVLTIWAGCFSLWFNFLDWFLHRLWFGFLGFECGSEFNCICDVPLVSFFIQRNIQVDKYSRWTFSLSPHLAFLPFINFNFSRCRDLALKKRGQPKGKHNLYETSTFL